MHHSLHLILDNQPGVQLRIAMVLTRRGFWTQSLTMFPMAGSHLQRMVMTIVGPEENYEQVCKQLAKLVEVVKVDPLHATVENTAAEYYEEYAAVEKAV